MNRKQSFLRGLIIVLSFIGWAGIVVFFSFMALKIIKF